MAIFFISPLFLLYFTVQKSPNEAEPSRLPKSTLQGVLWVWTQVCGTQVQMQVTAFTADVTYLALCVLHLYPTCLSWQQVHLSPASLTGVTKHSEQDSEQDSASQVTAAWNQLILQLIFLTLCGLANLVLSPLHCLLDTKVSKVPFFF